MSNLKEIATQIRRDIVRMVHAVQSGHPGGSLGCTEYFTALYFDIMKHDPKFNMDGTGEDIFFLSNGHISPVFYSALARSGYFPVEELNTFRKIDSRLQGHPTTHEDLPGVRIASGSLGQGMSVAVGAALAKKLNNDDRIVYSLHGDGELDEGQNWEAIMFAAHKKVDNLIATIDRVIPYHLLFVLRYRDQAQLMIGYKEESKSREDKFKVDSYYRTDWTEYDKLTLEIEGLDLDRIYENFIFQIAGDALNIEEAEDIRDAVMIAKEIDSLETYIAKLEKKIQKEKQFKLKVKINQDLRRAKEKLEEYLK